MKIAWYLDINPRTEGLLYASSISNKNYVLQGTYREQIEYIVNMIFLSSEKQKPDVIILNFRGVEPFVDSLRWVLNGYYSQGLLKNIIVTNINYNMLILSDLS